MGKGNGQRQWAKAMGKGNGQRQMVVFFTASIVLAAFGCASE